MSRARRVLGQALVLGVLSVVVAAAVHFPLVRRFVRGEFKQAFFSQADYPGIRLVTLQEAEELWREGEAVIFDARGAGPYGEGHVPGARNLPGAESGLEIPTDILELPRNRALVVYCEGGNCQSSLALARRLHDEDFRNIRVFSGGWAEWQAAGLPEEKSNDQE